MGLAMNEGPIGATERRRYPRIAPPESAVPPHVRLRPGREGLVVNVSRGGACVEASSRLFPGMAIEIQVALPDWQWQGEAQVLRCSVSALPRAEKVRYRAGLQFRTAIAPEGRRDRPMLSASPGG